MHALPGFTRTFAILKQVLDILLFSVLCTFALGVIAMLPNVPFDYIDWYYEPILLRAMIAGSLGSLYLRDFVSSRRDERARRELEISHPTKNPQIDAMIRLLRTRSAALRTQAQLVLVVILGTLGLGIYVFAKAEKFTQTPLTTATVHIGEANSRLADLSTALDRLIVSPRDTVQFSYSRNYMSRLDATLREQRTELGSVADIVRSRADAFASYAVVSAVTTRIGIILMLLFLVQILVTMYRYNSRLATHLEGRAVALQLASLHKKTAWKLTELANLFTAENLDFGKLPPTGIQSIAAVARYATTTARHRAVRRTITPRRAGRGGGRAG